jgi:hypothetical protein
MIERLNNADPDDLRPQVSFDLIQTRAFAHPIHVLASLDPSFVEFVCCHHFPSLRLLNQWTFAVMALRIW